MNATNPRIVAITKSAFVLCLDGRVRKDDAPRTGDRDARRPLSPFHIITLAPAHSVAIFSITASISGRSVASEKSNFSPAALKSSGSGRAPPRARAAR